MEVRAGGDEMTAESVGMDGKRKLGPSEHRFRMDFVNSVEWVDKEKGILGIVMRPDPRRYEWRDTEGHRGFYDRYDNVLISEEALKGLPRLAEALSIGLQPARIDYAPTYVRDRRHIIAEQLREAAPYGGVEPPSDKSDAFLEALGERDLGFAIVSLDLVGSTELSTQLPRDVYSRIVKTLAYECSLVVPEFHGHVLKYTGDGLIAYFPEPSFIIKNDLAIDCALTMHGLVYAAINPCLEAAGMPKIDVRIGLDSGEASVLLLGSGETKRHADIIGAAVSLACKVQSCAAPGGICVGETLERNLHVMWREIIEGNPEFDVLPYKGLDGQQYKVLRVLTSALERNLRSMEQARDS
jgi:class 3 adenylate cyclase